MFWYHGIIGGVADHTTMSLRLAPDVYEPLRKLAFEQHRTMVDLIREALVIYLREPALRSPAGARRIVELSSRGAKG